MMIEYTLYIYTGIKRNNIISLFNIESKKKRVKVVHVLNKLNSAYSKIYTLHIQQVLYIWKEDNEQRNRLRIMIGFTQNQKKNIQLYFYS